MGSVTWSLREILNEREVRAIKRSKGLTLVEVVVVIVCLGILTTVFVPVVRAAKQSNGRGVCKKNAQKIARACLVYAEDFDGYGPPQSFDEYVNWYGPLAPYLGGSPDDPKEEQIWYRTNGCPNWRPGRWASAFNASLTINNHLCNATRPHKLTEIEDTSAVIMSHDHWCAITNHGLFPPNALVITVRGAVGSDGQVRVHPHHKGKGLNFAFIDGHVKFHRYNPGEDGQRGTFEGDLRLDP